jgi:cytochrome P450
VHGDGTARAVVVDFDPLRHTTREEANDAWRALRATCPVAWTEHNGGHWVVAKHDEVAQAFRDWESFSSMRINDPDHTAMAIQRIKIPIAVPEELDPPVWQAYRRVMAELLSPGAVARMRPRVQEWVAHHIDLVIETGECDLVHDLASPIPGAVALEWLGFPRDDWRRISDCLHGLSGNVPGSPAFTAAQAEFQWVNQRIIESVEDRRARPRDDAISTIVTADIDGAPMPIDLAHGMVRLAIAGGVDTTTSLTSSALVHLHFHADDRQRLIDDPSLIDAATEEFLRFYPPARGHARTVAKEVELGGCSMKRGDRVLLAEVSACHDEDAFPEADRFIIDRFPNRHVAFGMGLHRCPGSHLARLQFKEILTQVLQRLPDYRIVEERLVQYPSWVSLGGWTSCPAVFTPGARRAA